MCTRYAVEKDLPELKNVMEAVKRSMLSERFISSHGRPIITFGDIRPTDIVPTLASNTKGNLSVFPMQWGFLAKDGKRTLFHARVETASQKPTFKDAWHSHRCIIPASYYYEWAHFKSADGRVKTGDKYVIQPKGCTLTWLCGLYRMENDYPVFVILTREPTVELNKIYDRMPLILPKDLISKWIDPYADPEEILPYALTDMIIEKAD
ncbi:MAG: SOS response-associated peptidase [Lachnospiraceae bacterium]|nr:SOS response-associated peptidase [Lachnospiraceae bacterium]